MHNNIHAEKSWTIAIIGAGPAGSATALSFFSALKALLPEKEWASRISVSLYDSYSLLLSEQKNHKFRVGETIPPAASPVLRRLGIFDILERGSKQKEIHLDCPGSISLWNDDKLGYNDFMVDIVGRGYHLNREVFDQQLLAKACSAGVVHQQGWQLTNVKTPQSRQQLEFTVLKENGKSDTTIVDADFVIDATGKSCAFSKHLNVCRNDLDKVIFLCAVIELPSNCMLVNNTLVEAVAEGWWYAARIPNNKIIITLCTDQQGIKDHKWRESKNWLALFSQTKFLKAELNKYNIHLTLDDIKLVTQSASSSLLSAVCGENWLAVGDAASSYDPISSAGITKALQQGEQAGKALAKLVTAGNNDLLQAYQQQVLDDFMQYIEVRNELYASEQRFSECSFWQRRLGESN